MRILNLKLGDGGELDLHPYVSIISGLDPARRRLLATTMSRLARGHAEGAQGLVEAHGLLVPVDQTRLDALGLPADLDVIVRAEQLPGAHVVQTEDALSPAQKAAHEQGEALGAELARVEAEIQAETARLADLQTELEQARRALDEFAVTAHETAQSALTEAEAAVRARLHPDEADTWRARSELVAQIEAEQARLVDFAAELDEDRLALLEVLELLEEERSVLEALRSTEDENAEDEVLRLDLPAPELVDQVAVALEAVKAGPPPPPLVPSLPASALADQISSHRRRTREVEQELNSEGLDLSALRTELARVGQEAAAALEASKPKRVSPEDDVEIERLHDLVVENSEKRSSRRGGKAATIVYEEASAELDALLERCGFPTYAAYIVGRTAPTINHEAIRLHKELQARAEELEADLERVTSSIRDDPRMMMLHSEREQLWGEAGELLGIVPDDVEGALRALRVPGPVDFRAPDELRSALRRVGIDESPADPDELVKLAAGWIEEAEALAQQAARIAAQAAATGDAQAIAAQAAKVDEILAVATEGDEVLAKGEQQHAVLEAQLAQLVAELEALEADAAPDDDVADAMLAADPVVTQAREQVKLTTARLERHHVAVANVDRLNAAISETRRKDRELGARREAAKAERDAVLATASTLPVEWDLDERGAEPIEWYLLGRVASLRSVSPSGSVPLILDDAFRGLPDAESRALCAALATIGESVQVIYLGDAPAVAAWAEEQGLERAAVVRPGSTVS